MIEKVQVILGLLILKNSRFSDSYNFCKALSWKFKIINCREVIEHLITNNYIHAEYNNGIGSFIITKQGELLVVQNRDWAIERLKEFYSDELEFINLL